MVKRSALACAVLAALLLLSFPVSAQKALLLPSGGGASANFFTSEPFVNSGTFAVGTGAFAAFANPSASRCFIVSSANITIVDANGAPVSGSPVALGRPAMAAAITPDGGMLLILTGSSTTNAVLYAFNVASGIPVQIGSAQLGASPLDVTGSMDSKTAYVVTTIGVTEVDLSSASLPVGDTLSLTGLAAPYSGAVQGPSGLLYVNGADALYEIDIPALTVRHTIAIAGFPAKPSFTPDNKAVVANPGALSGQPALIVINLADYTSVTKPQFGPRFEKLLWTGTGKYYALSSSPRILYQTNEAFGDLARAEFAGQEVPSEVTDAFTTDESPLTSTGAGGPRYLFVMTLTDLYRYDLRSASTDPVEVIKTLPFSAGVRSGVYLAPVSTKAPAGIVHFGDDQQVVVGENPLPVVVRSIDVNGRPTSGTPITFSPSNTVSRMTATNTAGFAMAIPRTPVAGESFVVTAALAGTQTFYFNISGKTGGGGGGGGGQVEFTGISLLNGNGQGNLGARQNLEPVILQVTNSEGAPQAGVTVHLTVSAQPASPGVGSSTNACEVVHANARVSIIQCSP
jgi:hypothetical protein